jgi:hypothetical protein
MKITLSCNDWEVFKGRRLKTVVENSPWGMDSSVVLSWETIFFLYLKVEMSINNHPVKLKWRFLRGRSIYAF